MAKRITVVGSINTDMVVRTEAFPAPGETLIGGEFFLFPGGKGANQAVAAARLGGTVRFVGKVGDDGFGRDALAGLTTEGIDVANVGIAASTASGTALITVNSEGENTIVVAPGANATVGPDLVKGLAVEADELLLTQLETPLETVVELGNTPGRLVLNPAPAVRLPEELFPKVFVLTPNETEAEVLTGIPVVDTASAESAARVLLGKGVRQVIITLGKQGAYFTDGQRGYLVPAPEVKAVDTTAAGDVFNGALVVALAEGLPMREAMDFAVRAASVSVTRMGAQPSIPRREEIG